MYKTPYIKHGIRSLARLCPALMLVTLLTASCRKDTAEVTTTVKVQLTMEEAGVDASALRGISINMKEGHTGYTQTLTTDATGSATTVLPLGLYTFDVHTKRRLDGYGNVTLLANATHINVVDTDNGKNILTLNVGIYFE